MSDIRMRVDRDDRLVFEHDGATVAEYVFLPTEPQVESPRPYFSPLRTLGGRDITSFRPSDHVWHKGLSLALPVVDDENFWGGPSYVRESGYVQLPNNGSQVHRDFSLSAGDGDGAGDGAASITETLDWVTQHGALVLAEQRRLSAHVVDDDAWLLIVETSLRNVTPRTLSIGSPTTRGRADAGYGGLFWRGPLSFGGGTGLVHAASGSGQGSDLGGSSSSGDDLRGTRDAWMSFSGRHDEVADGEVTDGEVTDDDAVDDGAAAEWSTVVMVDSPQNPGHPTEWFVRSEEYACLCPAPFFSAEVELAAGETLTLSYAVVIADGPADRDRAAALAAAGQRGLDAATRSPVTPFVHGGHS